MKRLKVAIAALQNRRLDSSTADSIRRGIESRIGERSARVTKDSLSPSRSDSVGKNADADEHLFYWDKSRHVQRWIKSLISEQPTTSPKEFPLPKGEGQGEGKERSMTKLRMGFCGGSIESFRPRVRGKSAPSLSAAWILARAHWSAIFRHRLRRALLQLAPNRITDNLFFAAQARVPEAQHFDPARCKPGVPLRVQALLPGSSVLASIKLDVKRRLQTEKIENVQRIRMLSSKLVSRKAAITQPVPQQFLSPCIVLAQRARDTGEFRRSSHVRTLAHLRRRSIFKLPSPSSWPSPPGRRNSFVEFMECSRVCDSIQRWAGILEPFRGSNSQL